MRKAGKKTIAERLEEIRLAHGGKLRPPDVVAAARPKSDILHVHFTWDDSVAAEEFRIWEARELIRSVRVIHDEKEVAEYYNVRVVPVEESYYAPKEVLVKQQDVFTLAFAQLVEKVNAAKRSLDELQHIVNTTGGEDGE